MTPTVGETKNGVKTTQRSPRILPEVVIYDVERTLSHPAWRARKLPDEGVMVLDLTREVDIEMMERRL
jgi:hypothetical protein